MSSRKFVGLKRTGIQKSSLGLKVKLTGAQRAHYEAQRSY